MAFIISKEIIERDRKLKHYKDISNEAKNLVQALEGFFNGETTRSQLNKVMKRVKYLTTKEQRIKL